MFGPTEREIQQKQSEIFSFFLNYNKQFEKQTNDLSKIQTFLAIQSPSYLSKKNNPSDINTPLVLNN